jgi:hypothetical protein
VSHSIRLKRSSPDELFAPYSGERFTVWTHAGVMDKSRRDSQGIPMNFARFYFMDEIAAQEFRERWAA